MRSELVKLSSLVRAKNLHVPKYARTKTGRLRRKELKLNPRDELPMPYRALIEALIEEGRRDEIHEFNIKSPQKVYGVHCIKLHPIVIRIRRTTKERQKELETFLSLIDKAEFPEISQKLSKMRGQVRGRNIFWFEDLVDDADYVSFEDYLNSLKEDEDDQRLSTATRG